MSPERVGAAAEGDEGGAEVAEAGQGAGLGDQLPVPVLAHRSPDLVPPNRFGGRRIGEDDKGVREGVKEGDLTDLGKPRRWDAVVEDVEAVSVQDVGGAEPGEHHQEAELPHVEDGLGWEGAGE